MIQIKSIKNAMFWVLNTYLCEKEKVLGSELFKKILELSSMNGAGFLEEKNMQIHGTNTQTIID